MFIAVLFTTAEKWKHPSHPSIHKGIIKIPYIYTMEFYPVTKKHKIMKFEEKMINLEIILSELHQTLIDKCHIFSLTRGS